MGRGGQSPPGVDHSPLAHGLHRKDGSGVTLASRRTSGMSFLPSSQGHGQVGRGFTQAAVDAHAVPPGPGRRGS